MSMNTFTLYNLSESALELMEMIASGEITKDQIEDTLGAMMENSEQGIKDIAAVHQELIPQIDNIDTQIKRLQGKKKQLQERQLKLKASVGSVMHKLDIKKVQHDMFTVLNKPGTTSVEVINTDNLPDDLVTTKVTVSPDKKAIKAALNNGVDLSGAAKLVTTDYTIQIS
ncbi:Mu Gam-like end protection [Vibrio phage K250 g1]